MMWETIGYLDSLWIPVTKAFSGLPISIVFSTVSEWNFIQNYMDSHLFGSLSLILMDAHLAR